MIQIKGQFSLDDFTKAHQLHTRQRALSNVPRIYLVLLVAVFIVSLLILALFGRLQWIYLFATITLLLFFLGVQYLYRPYMLKRTFKNHPDLSAPFELGLSEEGLSITNPKGSALIPWTDYVKWFEGPDMLLLYRSYIMFQMVPKRLFNSDGDVQYLRDQLSRNDVPEAGRAVKRVPAKQYIIYIILFIAILVLLYLNLK